MRITAAIERQAIAIPPLRPRLLLTRTITLSGFVAAGLLFSGEHEVLFARHATAPQKRCGDKQREQRTGNSGKHSFHFILWRRRRRAKNANRTPSLNRRPSKAPERQRSSGRRYRGSAARSDPICFVAHRRGFPRSRRPEAVQNGLKQVFLLNFFDDLRRRAPVERK